MGEVENCRCQVAIYIPSESVGWEDGSVDKVLAVQG